MKKKLTLIAMLAMVASLAACGSTPDTSSSSSSSEAPSTSTSTSAPTPTTSTPEPTTSTPEPTTSLPEPTTSTPEPSTSTPEPTPSTPTVEVFEVKLPTLEGLSMHASKMNPEAGEEVTLYVTLDDADHKRLDGLTMNGAALELKTSNKKNTWIAKFEMPAKQDAIIDAEVVDVYAIHVADEVKDEFGIVCDVTAAAEGETVTFKAASYAGYWYKAVAAVEEDVILTVNEDGSYSFTMPAHAVTISAQTGTNVYAVTWDTEDCSVRVYRYVPSSTSDQMLKSYLSQGDAVPVGTELHFTVSNSGKKRTVDKVSFNGVDLELNSESEYVVSMPTYPVNIDVTMKDWIRNLLSEDGEHFSVSLTKEVTVDDVTSEVAASTGIYDDKIYVNFTDKTPEVEHKFVVSEVKLSYGNDPENVSNTAYNYTAQKDADGRYYFNIGDYAYTKVTIVEAESAIKGTGLAHNDYTGYKGYYGTTSSAELEETGKLSLGGSRYKNPTAIEGMEDAYELALDSTYSSNSLFMFAHKTDTYTALLLDTKGKNSSGSLVLSGRSDSYLVASGLGAFNIEQSYTYMLQSGSNIAQQFFHIAFADGTIDVFYDDAECKVYWGAKVVSISGDGKTVGDKLAIYDSENNFIAAYQVKKIDTQSNGYQHAVTAIESDAYAGTYTNGDSTLVLNGFGGATLDGAFATYTFNAEENKLVLTKDGTETAYILDLENHTFAPASLPTDGLDGTYTGDNGALVLDGYGKATLDGTEGTYTYENGTISISIGENSYEFALDTENHTYSSLSAFAGLKFKGTYYDTWDEATNTLYVDFDSAATISGQIRINSATYYFDFTGTYDASTNALTLTITKAVASDLVGKVLNVTVTTDDNGAFTQLKFNNDFGKNVYLISGAVVSLAD